MHPQKPLFDVTWQMLLVHATSNIFNLNLLPFYSFRIYPQPRPFFCSFVIPFTTANEYLKRWFVETMNETCMTSLLKNVHQFMKSALSLFSSTVVCFVGKNLFIFDTTAQWSALWVMFSLSLKKEEKISSWRNLRGERQCIFETLKKLYWFIGVFILPHFIFSEYPQVASSKKSISGLHCHYRSSMTLLF